MDDAVIAKLKEYGWTQDASSGEVRHSDLELAFPTWTDAVLACLDIALEA